MAADAVPPRVVPLFINELVTSAPPMQDMHIKYFTSNLARIFQARVVEEDIADLFVALCSICRLPRSYELLKDGASFPAFTALRLLLEMFNVAMDHSTLCLRVVKRLLDRFLRKRDDVAGHKRSGLGQLADQSVRGAGDLMSMTSRSGATHTTIDASAILATNATHHNNSAAALNLMDGIVDASAMIVRSAEAPNAMTALHIEQLLTHNTTRGAAYQLYQLLDRSGCDVTLLTSDPSTLHIHIPHRFTAGVKVFRDFVFCTPRPKLTKEWGPVASVHIKTNIAAKSEVMYRILVEGYNYGVNAPIFSDVVGYTNRNWDALGQMSKYGWPEGWDDTSTNDYAPGVTIGQYFSHDGFVVVRLQAKSLFSVGFGVSAWLCFHGMGNGFPIAATIHHQDVDL